MDAHPPECDGGPKRLRISWSQLLTHETCKQKSHLQRKQKRSPANDNRGFFHGIVVDRIMRARLEADASVGSGWMEAQVEGYIPKLREEMAEEGQGVVRWKHAGDREEMTALCREACRSLEPMLAKWVLPYDYQPEYRFNQTVRIPYLDGQLAEIELIGGIDILVRRSQDPLQFFGYDLKITRDKNYINKTLGQSIFYDLAVFAEFGVPMVQFGFLMPAVVERPTVPVNISQADRVSMLSRITKLAHDRWRGDVTPKQSGDGCAWCNVRHACSKYHDASTAFAPTRGAARAAG